MPTRTLQLTGTGRTIVLMIRATATTPAGDAKTGLAYNTSGLSIAYLRYDAEGQPTAASPSAITLATQTVNGAWSSGGFVEISSSTAPGAYRLDLPDAAIATGASGVSIFVSGTTPGVVADEFYIELPNYDPFAAPTVTDATIADAVWDEARSGHVTAGSFGEGVASVQGSVTGSVASVTGAVGSVTGNIGGNLLGTLSTTVLAAIADKLLGRNIAGGSDGTRTVTSALRKIRNKVAISGGTMTVYQEDDTTSDHTAAVTGTPSVTVVDP